MNNTHLSIEELSKLYRAGKVAEKDRDFVETVLGIKKVKKHKYSSKKTVVDDIEFDSVKEAKRYKELKLLLKVGEIGMLQRQVPFELNPGGTHSLKYVADFCYITREGVRVTEDCKGFRTGEYLKKKRLMKKVHQIEIRET
jgi:hypothetical protein